jgi:lipid A 4'-phosphatase
MLEQFYAPDSASRLVARRLGLGALAAGALATVVWLAFPGIDLAVARMFYRGGGRFTGLEIQFVGLLRNALIGAFFGTALVAIVAAYSLHKRGGVWLGLDKYRWLFVAICLGLGPGVVTNLIVKDQIGRARPKSVQEFGGDRTFTPALQASRQCTRSCSFVSGEASSSFVIFYAAAVAMPQAAPALIALGTIAGLLTGLVRMLQGAHFLSDVVFAGVFMALTVSLAYVLLSWLDAQLRQRYPAAFVQTPARE